ncbi:hypothetical protein KKE06_04310 [Candidatus Micrarchaeota archaeon]|nr:hypothetical protein [Candidatus Micrarchaeota archaeon]MBU1930324.1 hypothetical protein [Candidatus Micrarchaeota archaeon]
MREDFSGYPKDKLVLSDLESQILRFVLESWPSSPLHVAEHFQADLSSFEARKRASARFAYYLQKLVRKQLLLSKRVGHALIVWPLEVEKYRALHLLLQSDDFVAPKQLDVVLSIEKELVKKPGGLDSFKGVA